MNVLYNRLSLFMDLLISDNKYMFIQNRSIGDHTMYAHEFIRGFGSEDKKTYVHQN